MTHVCLRNGAGVREFTLLSADVAKKCYNRRAHFTAKGFSHRSILYQLYNKTQSYKDLCNWGVILCCIYMPENK
jgi:hypothetical protein